MIIFLKYILRIVSSLRREKIRVRRKILFHYWNDNKIEAKVRFVAKKKKKRGRQFSERILAREQGTRDRLRAISSRERHKAALFTSRIRSRCNIHRLTQPFANICFYDTRTFSPRAFINRGEGWNFWECFIIRDPGLAYKNRPPLSLSLFVGCVPLVRGVIALPWSDLCTGKEQSLREWTTEIAFPRFESPYQDTQRFPDKRNSTSLRILFFPFLFYLYLFIYSG